MHPKTIAPGAFFLFKGVGGGYITTTLHKGMFAKQGTITRSPYIKGHLYSFGYA